MKVLITGADGMLARAVQNHCRSAMDEVAAFPRKALDISDAGSVSAKVAEVRPDVVMNCAAYTDVDGAESNIRACYLANVDGVANLARACRAENAGFVTISSDYVFDGSKTGFYTQHDTPVPQGVYAKAKREGEIIAFAMFPRSIIVRSGWIYGVGGSNFLSMIPKLLSENRPFKAINDSFGTPTFAKDLAARLRELAVADVPGVYHAANDGPGCSYLDFANAAARLGNYDSELIESVSHKDLSRPALRPVSSKLACVVTERIGLARMRPWEDALAEFVRSRTHPRSRLATTPEAEQS